MMWEKWIEYTRVRAKKKSDWDRYVYGTGYMLREWWGFRHIPASRVFLSYRGDDTPKPYEEE